MNKKYLFALSIITFLIVSIPKASAEDVLVFHLEKSGGKLQFDASAPKQITTENDPNFSIVEFSKKEVSGEYRIELFDTSGAKAFEANIPTQNGKFTYEIPKFTIISKYQIYVVSDSRLIFEGNLDEFVLCNNNKVCEFEKGETINTCLSDCASGSVSYSPETKAKLDAAGGIIRDPKTGDILLNDIKVDASQNPAQTETKKTSNNFSVIAAVVVVIVLLVIGVVVYFIRRR
jgi:hypothetical protein